MYQSIKIAFASMLLLSTNGAANADHGGLLFMYSDHEPYIVSTNTGLGGFLANYVRRVAADAGIAVHWSNVPWKDQLPTLKRDAKNVCAVTLFKTPEREKYLRYTTAVGTSGRFVLLGAKNNVALFGHDSLRAVIEDPSLTPVLQPNTIYNSYIDGLLKDKNFPRVGGSVERIARSHLSDVQRYFIVSDVRGRAFLKKRDNSDVLAVYSHYNDLADSVYHYIGCSKSTDDELFEQLNAAILQAGFAVPD